MAEGQEYCAQVDDTSFRMIGKYEKYIWNIQVAILEATKIHQATYISMEKISGFFSSSLSLLTFNNRHAKCILIDRNIISVLFVERTKCVEYNLTSVCVYVEEANMEEETEKENKKILFKYFNILLDVVQFI